MKINHVYLFFCLLIFGRLQATHNRAGEITYTRISPTMAIVSGVEVEVYRYRITIVKYTNFGDGIIDRCSDTAVYFGDGEKGIAYRVNGNTFGCLSECNTSVPCGSIIISTPGYTVNKSIYMVEHTYPGPGKYRIRTLEPNRNFGIKNIPNSVNLPFYLEAFLEIKSFSGANTSPVLKYDPIDKGCIGQCFQHNPAAFDPDGDSLSYELTTCRGEGGNTIPGYTYPDAGPGGLFTIDPVTGMLNWCNPQEAGEYNIAFIIREWRKDTNNGYYQIGYVLRDMQVIIGICNTASPPIVITPVDTCVEAGTLIEKTIVVTDTNTNHLISLEGAGGAFEAASPAALLTNTQMIVNQPLLNTLSASFSWQTNCDHLRNQAYYTVFKAQDNTSNPKMVRFAIYNIRVRPPSVKNVTAIPFGSSMKISWDFSTCSPLHNPLVGYKVYRKNNCEPYKNDACSNSVLVSSGFELVGQTSSKINQLIDDNNGDGLVVGESYSYMVIALYADSMQSHGSNQVCAKLKRDVPVILNVDVLSTSDQNGSILIRWSKPLTTPGNLDPVVFPGPYKFILKHLGATGLPETIFTTSATTLAQLETEFIHKNLNTTLKAEEYVIEFVSGTTPVGSSQKATSVFLSLTGSDRQIDLKWGAKTPWKNYNYTVKRKNPGETTFKVVATTTAQSFVDTETIVNNYTYCYQVTSEGAFSDAGLPKPLINNSQQMCVLAEDKTAPCSPTLNIEADCPSGYLKITWNDIAKSCDKSDDVVSYQLFHRPTVTNEYTLRSTFTQQSIKEYVSPANEPVQGCFIIVATDSSGNASKPASDFCIDNCPVFELPNVFTPNNDNINDNFQAVKIRQVLKIDLKVFDRWGNLVYNTTDPYFKWNGQSNITNQQVSEGTFFYLCDVFEPRLRGINKRTLKGTVTMLR